MRVSQVKRAHRTPSGAAVALGVAAAVLCARAGAARADGGIPGSLSILLPQDKPQEIGLATTFGLILSSDGGATWTWTCEQAATTSMANIYTIGAPPLASGGLGDRFYALSPIEGLAYSDDQSCNWTSAGGALAGQAVSDFFPDPTNPARVLAAAAPAGDGGAAGTSAVYLSMDGGVTFGATPLFTAPAGSALVGIEVARSDPSVIYLAYALTTPGGYDSVLVRSSNNGQTWSAPIDLVAALGAALVRILAVDAADANRVYLRASTTSADVVAVTPDGGVSFVTPITLPNGSVTAFARLASGSVLVGATTNEPGGATVGSGYRSTDGGMTFGSWSFDANHLLSPDPPHVVGLAERTESGKPILYLSGKNYSDGWALATSTDEGQTLTAVMSYDQVSRIAPCVQQICADTCGFEEMQGIWTPEVCAGATPDGGTTPASGGGCHCAVTDDRTAAGAAWAVALACALLVIVRRARGRDARRG